MLFLVILPLLVIGIWLVVRGARGLAIDDHPVCRHCRFDLVGLPPTSARCSECGADLSRPRAVVTGNRRRRPGLIVGGVLLLVPSLAGVVLVAAMTVSDIAWIRCAPYWYVLGRARNPAATIHDPALAEIARRLTISSLSDVQIASVVDAGLSLQSDPAAAWVPAWGDLIESARSAGKVPDEKWRRYLTNAPAFTLAVRPEVRRGDRLIAYIHQAPARVGRSSTLWAQMHLKTQPDSDLLASSQPAEGGSNGTGLSASGSGSIGQSFNLSPTLLAGAPDGRKTFHLKLVADVYVNNPAGQKVPPDATTTFDMRAPWTLVPADAPTIRAIDDPAARPAIEAGIHVEEVAFRYSPDNVQVRIKLDSLPVSVAYRVFLRSGGREWDVGYVDAAAHSSTTTTFGTGGNAEGLTADRADVVFRPDPSVAASTIDIKDYWNGEVVIKDVPVQRPAKKD